MKGSIIGAFVLVVFALSIRGSAMAQERTDEISVVMDEVVVTGTRTVQETRRIPANVTVIDREDIEESNAQNLPDLLRTKEGVVVRDTLGNGKKAEVDLRGFGETGPFNTLVLLDGRRLNAADQSGVDWAQIPLEQIERVEVVRGMGSVLYGDNAVGGVINIISRVPEEGFSFSAGGTVGSYSKHKEYFSLTSGQERIGMSLFGSYQSTDGYRENNEYRVKDIGGNIVFNPTDRLQLDLSGSFHSDEYGMPGTLSEEEFRDDPRGTNSPFDEAETTDEYVKLGLELDLAGTGLLMTDVSYRSRENQWLFANWSSEGEGEIDSFALTPRYVCKKSLGGFQNTIITGMDFSWVDQENNSFSGGSPTGRDTIERSRYGVYVNDEFSLTEDLILSAGMRREKVKDRLKEQNLPSGTVNLDQSVTNSETALRVGLVYLLGERSSLFARFNRSFRFPLTDELTKWDAVSSTNRINPDIKAQTGDHFELGARHAFSDDITGKVTLFRMEIDNEIFYNPATYSNENHPDTLHQGIEVGTEMQLLERVTLFGNYTYEKATFEEDPFRGNDIPAVPEHKANLGVKIRDILPNLDFSVVYNYVGSSYLISDQANALRKLDDYEIINVRLSYEFGQVKAFFGVNNVTDEEYAQYAVAGSSGTTRNFYPAPARNWLAGVEILF